MDGYTPSKEWEDPFGTSSVGRGGNSSRQTKIKENKKYSRVENDHDFESGLSSWTRDENLSGKRVDAGDGVSALESAVSQLKSVGYGIQSEVNLHLNMLDEMSSDMDPALKRVRTSQKVLNGLVNMARTTTLVVIAFLLFILLILQWVL